MVFDVGLFRAQFPEFSDTVLYPDQQISFWSGFTQGQLPKNVWCGQWVMAVSLYTAHELVLAAQAAKTAAAGGAPGTFGGIANTKTVGSVTVGYDAQTTTEKDAGYWNLTTYGKQLYRLIRMFGAQCIQL